jgi:hypothetical protein
MVAVGSATPVAGVVLLLLRLNDACNSNDQCDFPHNNVFTTHPTWDTHSARTDFPGPCCAVMPGVPQVETGGSSAPLQPWNPQAKLIHPPDMEFPGAACPPVPDDVLLVPKNLPGPTNGSVLYSHTEVFFEGWAWDSAGLGDSGFKLPNSKKKLSSCHKPHPFYTQYTNAYANDTNYTMGMPTLGSSAAHPNAVLKAADTLAQMLSQVDRKVPGVRQYMVEHRSRFAVWADSERRNDTCAYCKRQDDTFDCGAHIDSRPGRDTSLHPEIPLCNEAGGGGIDMPTTLVEEYGICYLDEEGNVPDSYCGTNIVAHEFFHAIHGVALKSIAPQVFTAIEQAALRAVDEGIYQHHPGALDDGCDADFKECIAFEFIVKAHLVWHGFPCDPREFKCVYH